MPHRHTPTKSPGADCRDRLTVGAWLRTGLARPGATARRLRLARRLVRSRFHFTAAVGPKSAPSGKPVRYNLRTGKPSSTRRRREWAASIFWQGRRPSLCPAATPRRNRRARIANQRAGVHRALDVMHRWRRLTTQAVTSQTGRFGSRRLRHATLGKMTGLAGRRAYLSRNARRLLRQRGAGRAGLRVH